MNLATSGGIELTLKEPVPGIFQYWQNRYAELVVDNLIMSAVRHSPHGADVVVHSLSKTAAAGGCTISGAVIARHDLVSRHLDDEVKADYGLWLKLWPFRDSGPSMSPLVAHAILGEVRTLRLKMEQMSRNTMEVARFLVDHEEDLIADVKRAERGLTHRLHAADPRRSHGPRRLRGRLQLALGRGRPRALGPRRSRWPCLPLAARSRRRSSML